MNMSGFTVDALLNGTDMNYRIMAILFDVSDVLLPSSQQSCNEFMELCGGFLGRRGRARCRAWVWNNLC